jgi:hypothetical protein
MAKIDKVLEKIEAYKKFPDMVKPLSPEELAELVTLLIDRVAKINTFNENKTQDFAEDFKQTKTQLEDALKALMSQEKGNLSQLANQLEKRVEATLAAIKAPENGKDAEITEEFLQRVVVEASALIEIPDFDPVVDERITANKEAVRDALELFDKEEDKLAIEAVGGLVSKLEDLEKQIKQNNGNVVGGVSVSTVLRLIAENGGGGGLPDQTGNSGRFLTTNGTDPSWAAIPGGGNMLTSVYDPNTVGGDAFAMDNMVEGTNTKVLTAAERTKLSNTNGTNTGDQDLSGYALTASLGTAAAANTGDFATAAQGALANSATQPGDALTTLSGDLPFSQITQIATNRILGRSTAGTGDIEALTGATARDIIGVDTDDSPQFAGVNIGHATDTTITRTAAGTIAVEGNVIYRAGGTDVPVADGGTGASTAAGARTNLGVDVTKATNFKVKAITVESPTATEDISMFFTDDAVTVTQLNAVLRGSSTPSVTWTIRHSTDRSAAGNEVVTSGTTTTSTTTGSEVTSFNDATIPAGSFVWLETSAQSGTVDELNVIIEFTID